MSSVPKSQYDDLQNRHVRMRKSREREQRRCSKLEIRISQLEAAVLAEREANAIICHEIQMTKYSHDSGDEYYQGYGEGAKDCWQAIRDRK